MAEWEKEGVALGLGVERGGKRAAGEGGAWPELGRRVAEEGWPGEEGCSAGRRVGGSTEERRERGEIKNDFFLFFC